MNTKEIEAAIQDLQDNLAKHSNIPTYRFFVRQEDENSWSIESEYHDESNHRDIKTLECCGMFENELVPYIDEELFHIIARRHNNSPAHLRLIIFSCVDNWNKSYKYYMTCKSSEVDECIDQQKRLSTEIVSFEVIDRIFTYTK